MINRIVSYITDENTVLDYVMFAIMVIGLVYALFLMLTIPVIAPPS